MTSAYRLRVAAHVKNLGVVRHFIEVSGAHLDVHGEATADLIQATEEAVANLIAHGYRGTSGIIEVEARREGDLFVVCLRDESPPFDPTSVPAPDLTTPLEKRRLGGLGIHMMRMFADEIVYQSSPGGYNELKLIKRAAPEIRGDQK